MIGRLRGTLVRKEPPGLLVDVAGVGYEIEAPLSVFTDLPSIGEPVTLHTQLIVREDAHLLFGFTREAQRRQFRALLKVNGIGPRVALAVLSGLSEPELARCVAHEDIARLTRIPGIGRKTAERMIVELRDKLTLVTGGMDSQTMDHAMLADPVNEAVSALIALGYKPQEASQVVRGVPVKGLSTEQIIRHALKVMAG